MVGDFKEVRLHVWNLHDVCDFLANHFLELVFGEVDKVRVTESADKDREKGASLAGWVSRQRFKRYDEVIAGVDDYRWLIAVARDRSEVIICPDINERTKFARSLGPEYLEAERAVNKFRNECLEVM